MMVFPVIEELFNMLVNDDFKNDAALLLSGDWNSEEEMQNFLTDVCNKLNRHAELEQEREELKCKLCECDKDYTQDMVWIKCLNLQERHRLEAENAKLKEKLEYFSDKSTEYLNELWELKKKNALLEADIEMLKGVVLKQKMKLSTRKITPQIYQKWLDSIYEYDDTIGFTSAEQEKEWSRNKLNELMEGLGHE